MSDVLDKQWANFRDCPKCGAEKGNRCRTPACVQLIQAPIHVQKGLAMSEDDQQFVDYWKKRMLFDPMKNTYHLSRDDLIKLLQLGSQILPGLYHK